MPPQHGQPNTKMYELGFAQRWQFRGLTSAEGGRCCDICATVIGGTNIKPDRGRAWAARPYSDNDLTHNAIM